MNVIDFDDLQMKPLLHNLITQTILPLDDFSMNIKEGDIFDISFNNNLFKDYKLMVTNVSFTCFNKIGSADVSKNGFVYKPAFMNFMREHRNIGGKDSIVKLDFMLVRSVENVV